jgi:hypothetical protein
VRIVDQYSRHSVQGLKAGHSEYEAAAMLDPYIVLEEQEPFPTFHRTRLCISVQESP